MPEATVLFVDDEEPILRALQRALRKEPYRILTAGSGEEGLEIISREEIELVVSDQRMPVMTGAQFLHKVQEISPSTVRVILSGYAEASIMVEAINSGGVYRFISKPWNDEDLKQTLRQCLEHHEILKENRRLSELSARQVIEMETLNLRLETEVAARTRSLACAQDMLESLPRAVLGISRDHELVIANEAARRLLPALATTLPGTDIAEVLSEDAVSAVSRCFESGTDSTGAVECEGGTMQAHVALLGDRGTPRGCVLLLEEE
jgi:response regulator RpfG family c-di-GMP phosphodiesterase